jgi:hypothetical protein
MSDNEGHCLSKRIDELEAELAEQIRLAKLLHDDLRGEIAEKDEQIAALTAEANKNMEELCELRQTKGERGAPA